MALIGDFSDTSFADLIQLYAGTRQTVAVTVNLPEGKGEDGVFYVENGEIVDAWLGEARGRAAVRRALALGAGSFIVEPEIRSSERTVAEPWRQVLLEELVKLDEERRTGATPTPTPLRTRTATGSAPIASRNGTGAHATNGTGAHATNGAGTGGTGTGTGSRRLAGKTPAAPPPVAPMRAQPTPPPVPPQATGRAGGQPPRAKKALSPKLVIGAGAGVAVALMVGAIVYANGHRKPAVTVDASGNTVAAPAEAPPPLKPVAVVPKYVFGMAAPLYGADKDLGRGMKAGIEIAFAAANEAGGIHGRRLELVALDDGNEPAKSAQAMKDLVEKHKVVAVIGNAGTATAAADVPVALDQKVPLLGAIAGGPALRKDPPDRYVFVFRPGIADETAAAVRYLVDVRRLAPADIAFFGQDDEFGEAGWNGFARALKERDRDPARALRLSYRRNSADVDAALKRFRGTSAPKAVVMAAAYAPAARFIELVKAAQPGTIFTDVSSVDATGLAERLLEAKVALADDVVVTQVVPAPDSRASATMRYRSQLEKHALGERPGYVSLEGWVVGTMVVEALKRAGGDVDREKLVDALESMHDLDIGIGSSLAFSKNDHQASHKVWGTTLAGNGTWHAIDLE
jgi:ABC-type branched-subunit amino acid transport system substrate-binding protein